MEEHEKKKVEATVAERGTREHNIVLLAFPWHIFLQFSHVFDDKNAQAPTHILSIQMQYGIWMAGEGLQFRNTHHKTMSKKITLLPVL